MAGNVRRTWDKGVYEARAKERAEQGGDEGGSGGEEDDAATALARRRSKAEAAAAAAAAIKEEFLPAELGAAGPMGSARAFVKARQGKLDLDSNVGKTQIVTTAAIEAGVGAGYWCEVCSCVLKDSNAYLDHINGKKHQRALGFSMRVERVGADAVRSKLEALKQKLAAGSSSSSSSGSGTTASAAAASSSSSSSAGGDGAQALDEDQRKKRKRQEAEARRLEREAADLETADPEIAALMGFGSFGGAGGARKK